MLPGKSLAGRTSFSQSINLVYPCQENTLTGHLMGQSVITHDGGIEMQSLAKFILSQNCKIIDDKKMFSVGSC